MVSPRINPLFHALTTGSNFRQYWLLEQIGVGGEGVVWSALDQKQNQIHAIKFRQIPEAGENDTDFIGDRLQLDKLIKLQHLHILPVLEHGFEGQLGYIVSPYLSGGTLTQKIKLSSPSTKDILKYGMEIASSLDYLHNQGIIHRDLKSQNILIDLQNRCYLADFGLARLVTTSTLAFHTGHGTPPYASPEQIQSRPITHKSDLFSFGILLYEMFTGQLPWNGKKQLGIEQITSNQEIPDPREFNDKLPVNLVNVLRRVTSADIDLRPPSATEIMRVVGMIIGLKNDLDVSGNKNRPWLAKDEEVEEMLQQAFIQWNATNETYNLGLTKFALVDSRRHSINLDMYNRFMVSQALTYAYHDDFWWSSIKDPAERLSTASRLLRKQNESITGRVVTHLISDPNLNTFRLEIPEETISLMLDTGLKTDNSYLRREIFEGLRKLSRQNNSWNNSSNIDKEHSKRLAIFALEDSEVGDAAAELIGHMRSALAVQGILKHANEGRKISALLAIQSTAESLPPFVPNDLRFRLSMEWIAQRFIQSPVSLIGAYLLILFGTTLGIGIQGFVTYRLPNLLDTARITDSLQQGLIIGAIFSLGIFFIRIVMERFSTSATTPRLLLGTIVGSLFMNIALLVFHVLYLNTPPNGYLISAACLLMAGTFTISGLFQARLLKMILTSLSIFIGIVGTWWLHVMYTNSTIEMTPVFQYEYFWTMPQVALTAISVALSIGIFGNLATLSVAEE